MVGVEHVLRANTSNLMLELFLVGGDVYYKFTEILLKRLAEFAWKELNVIEMDF